MTSYGSLSGVELCDRCFDHRVSDRMGLPVLPDPPAEEALTGPDGRRHRFAYRLWRAPTGIVAEAHERGCADEEGYQASVLGSHDADTDVLLARLRLRLHEQVALSTSGIAPEGVLSWPATSWRVAWCGTKTTEGAGGAVQARLYTPPPRGRRRSVDRAASADTTMPTMLGPQRSYLAWYAARSASSTSGPGTSKATSR